MATISSSPTNSNTPLSSSPASVYSNLSRPESTTSIDSAADNSSQKSQGQHCLLVAPGSNVAFNNLLKSAAASLREKEFLLLVVRHAGPSFLSPDEKAKSLYEALAEASEVHGNEALFKEWVEVGERMFRSGAEGKAIDEVIDMAVVDASEMTYEDVLFSAASSNLRLLLCLPFILPSATTDSSCALYLFERPPFAFPPLAPPAQHSNPFGPPTLEEWKTSWAAWDFVTLQMIPREMLHVKPIELRHKCLFYVGHLNVFPDMLLSHHFKQPYTEPKAYTRIFERGIDPHVDDPDHCHSHSEVPEKDEDWPSLESVLEYRERVRKRVMKVYEDVANGEMIMTRRLARVLQMIHEHEGFHIETLLYMVLQRAGSGMRTPPGFTTPAWETLAAQWARVRKPTSKTVELGPQDVVLGLDDRETADLDLGDESSSNQVQDVYAHEFGWDNESPKRSVRVERFRIDWRPVTNGEYAAYWEKACTRLRNGEVVEKDAGSQEEVEVPASWDVQDGEILVRTLYGPVPLATAEHWPVIASYDALAAYAASKGGRIPREEELRLFWDTFDAGHAKGSNTGFRFWHPTPATTGLEGNAGVGTNGGVWEWTSTVFDGHPGMDPTAIFPGYSSDFFDGKHQVAIGASYATTPRLAGRRTLRNFYQHNYPFAWVGARVAYDV